MHSNQIKHFLLIILSVTSLSISSQPPSENDLYGYINNLLETESREVNGREAITDEYHIAGFGRIIVKEVDTRSSYTNYSTKKAEPIFLNDITDSVLYLYKNDRLIRRLISNKQISYQYHYSEDTLHFIEMQRNSANSLKIQHLFNAGLSENFKTNLITVRQVGSNYKNSKSKLYKAGNNIVSEILINFSGGHTTSSTFTRTYDNIAGKKRIVSETIERQDGSFRVKNNYSYQLINDLLVETVIDEIHDKYALRTKYDDQGRIVEKGIYDRQLNSGELKFLVLNQIVYNDGEIIISEYQNSFYNETSLKKNIHKQFILTKNGFRNDINYVYGTNGTKVLLSSDISEKLHDNTILKEKTFKNGKEAHFIDYHYTKNDMWISGIVGILYFNADLPHGIVYSYKRDFK